MDEIVVVRRSVHERQMPDVEVDRPHADCRHGVREEAKPVDHLDVEDRLHHRPIHAEHEQQRGEVADEEVLRHVGGEHLVRPRVHRRAERREQHDQPADEAPLAPRGHGPPVRRERLRTPPVADVREGRNAQRDQLQHRFEVELVAGQWHGQKATPAAPPHATVRSRAPS